MLQMLKGGDSRMRETCECGSTTFWISVANAIVVCDNCGKYAGYVDLDRRDTPPTESHAPPASTLDLPPVVESTKGLEGGGSIIELKEILEAQLDEHEERLENLESRVRVIDLSLGK